MMAMASQVGQWLGFQESTTSSSSSSSASTAVSVRDPPKPLSIAAGKRPRAERARTESAPARTKSEELLRDFGTLAFLGIADEDIQKKEKPLRAPALARLETLGAQAAADDCEILADIVDHLQDENGRLVRKIDERVNGASSRAFRPVVFA